MPDWQGQGLSQEADNLKISQKLRKHCLAFPVRQASSKEIRISSATSSHTNDTVPAFNLDFQSEPGRGFPHVGEENLLFSKQRKSLRKQLRKALHTKNQHKISPKMQDSSPQQPLVPLLPNLEKEKVASIPTRSPTLRFPSKDKSAELWATLDDCYTPKPALSCARSTRSTDRLNCHQPWK